MTVIDLQRFVDAQDDHGTFARALDELAAGLNAPMDVVRLAPVGRTRHERHSAVLRPDVA